MNGRVTASLSVAVGDLRSDSLGPRCEPLAQANHYKNRSFSFLLRNDKIIAHQTALSLASAFFAAKPSSEGPEPSLMMSAAFFFPCLRICSFFVPASWMCSFRYFVSLQDPCKSTKRATAATFAVLGWKISQGWEWNALRSSCGHVGEERAKRVRFRARTERARFMISVYRSMSVRRRMERQVISSYRAALVNRPLLCGQCIRTGARRLDRVLQAVRVWKICDEWESELAQVRGADEDVAERRISDRVQAACRQTHVALVLVIATASMMVFETATVATVTIASTALGVAVSTVKFINVSATAISRHRARGRLRLAGSSRRGEVVCVDDGSNRVFGTSTA